MPTVWFDDEVEVSRKGFTPDPPGSQYCVMDYVNDELAKVAARIFASLSREKEPAFSEALFASLAGEEQEAPLLIYQLELEGALPDARFIVLNYTRRYPARVAMQVYASKIKDINPGLGARLQGTLKASDGEFASFMISRLPKKKKRKNAKKEKTRS